MKTISILIFVFLLNTPLVQAQELMIFIDKSNSIDLSNTLKQEKFLYQELHQHFNTTGKTAVIKLIFENTASVVNEKKYTYSPPAFNSTLHKKTEVEFEKKMHQSKIRRYKKSLIRKIIAESKTFSQEAKETHILSSLVSISKIQTPNSKIIIISDFLEYSSIRKIRNSTFKNENDAAIAGKNDVLKLRNTYKLPDKIENEISIICVLPVQQNHQNKSFSFLESYWRTVFEEFGIVNVKFRTL